MLSPFKGFSNCQKSERFKICTLVSLVHYLSYRCYDDMRLRKKSSILASTIAEASAFLPAQGFGLVGSFSGMSASHTNEAVHSANHFVLKMFLSVSTTLWMLGPLVYQHWEDLSSARDNSSC